MAVTNAPANRTAGSDLRTWVRHDKKTDHRESGQFAASEETRLRNEGWLPVDEVSQPAGDAGISNRTGGDTTTRSAAVPNSRPVANREDI